MNLPLPFELTTDLEHRIAADRRWQEGMEWGRPRRGHPEGTIKAHIGAVLHNVEKFYGESPMRADLRVIALVHDSFKAEVDESKPRTGENHHAV